MTDLHEGNKKAVALRLVGCSRSMAAGSTLPSLHWSPGCPPFGDVDAESTAPAWCFHRRPPDRTGIRLCDLPQSGNLLFRRLLPRELRRYGDAAAPSLSLMRNCCATDRLHRDPRYSFTENPGFSPHIAPAEDRMEAPEVAQQEGAAPGRRGRASPRRSRRSSLRRRWSAAPRPPTRAGRSTPGGAAPLCQPMEADPTPVPTRAGGRRRCLTPRAITPDWGDG